MQRETPEDVRLRVQILATEHWSLLTARTQLWNEAFSRGGMFLAVVSGSVVAMALVAQATSFGEEFALFSLLLLPMVIFVGVVTFVRVVQSNAEDRRWLLAMNRIRHGYLHVAPDLEPYFTTSQYDDPAGLVQSYGRSRGMPTPFSGLLSTAGVVSTVNGMLVAIFVGLVVSELGGGVGAVAAAGVAGFAVITVFHLRYQHRVVQSMAAFDPPRFPSPGREW
jgi:hypothetical protein